jgi:ribonuclease HI
MSQEKIFVFTDGSSRGNPGPGGFGVILSFGKKRMELSQ